MTLDPNYTGMGGGLSGGTTGLSALAELLKGRGVSDGMKSMYGPDDRPLQTAQQQQPPRFSDATEMPRGLTGMGQSMGYPSLGSFGGNNAPAPQQVFDGYSKFGGNNSGGIGSVGGQSMSLGNLSVNFNPSGGASFAKGGQVHGLKAVAQELQDMGRGGDTMLAHINPQEAALLKRMGGSGTINPATGLPEFVKFGSIGRAIEKPFRSSGVIGGALKPIIDPLRNIVQDLGPIATIGAGLYAPWAAGIVGGLQGQKSFDFKRALLTGAMAYGARGLAEGVSDVGSPSIPGISVDDAGVALLPADAAAMGSSAFVPPVGFDDAGTALLPADSAAMQTGLNNNMFSDAASGVAKDVSDFGSGLKNIASGNVSMGQFSNAVKNAPSNVFGLGPSGLGAAGMIGYSGVAALDEQEKFLREQLEKGDIANDEFNAQMARIEASRQRSEDAVRRNPYMFAEGGEVPRFGLGGITSAVATGVADPNANITGKLFGQLSNILKKAQVAIPSTPVPEEARSAGVSEAIIAKSSPEQLAAYLGELRKASGSDKSAYLALLNNPMNFAYGGSVDDTAGRDDLSPTGISEGGLGNLSQGLRFAQGGQPRFLSGGGDGMSDDIPATIGGKQPARLADGEFVIPADVVSHLGNGSSKAGAKQLYSMMDKVRSARTGTKKQGKQISPAKFMPA
jgi:hypothetical protein